MTGSSKSGLLSLSGTGSIFRLRSQSVVVLSLQWR